MCEYCSKLLPLLESGEVCEGKCAPHNTIEPYMKKTTVCGSHDILVCLCVHVVCGYTCHEDCYKKTHKKCEGKGRSKPIPEYNPKVIISCYHNHNLKFNCAKVNDYFAMYIYTACGKQPVWCSSDKPCPSWCGQSATNLGEVLSIPRKSRYNTTG